MEELAEMKKACTGSLQATGVSGNGAEQASAAGTREMALCWLHLLCAGKQGSDEHWGVQPHYPTAFTIVSM